MIELVGPWWWRVRLWFQWWGRTGRISSWRQKVILGLNFTISCVHPLCLYSFFNILVMSHSVSVPYCRSREEELLLQKPFQKAKHSKLAHRTVASQEWDRWEVQITDVSVFLFVCRSRCLYDVCMFICTHLFILIFVDMSPWEWLNAGHINVLYVFVLCLYREEARNRRHHIISMNAVSL